jgi:uncharacterized protein (DUF3084 family)
MLYLLVLILLLVALAGIIAYAGDVLGTLVGRRRLSLFGWRPRLTGQIVGIAAGVLIMLTTMSTLALAFRGATTAIISAERVERELRGLHERQGELLVNVGELEEAIAARAAELQEALGERDTLQRDIGELQERFAEARASFEAERLTGEAQLERLSGELSSLSEELAQAERELGEARDETQAAREDVANLRNREVELQQSLAALLDQAETLHAANVELQDINENLEITQGELEERVERQAQEYRLLQERAQRAESGQIAFTNDEFIHSARIQAQESGEINIALSDMVRAADAIAQRRGAEGISLRGDQFARLVEAISDTPGEDFVVLLSKNNQLIGERLEVRVEAWENRLLLHQGQLLTSRPLYLGTGGSLIGQEELRGALRRLREGADRELKRLGFFEFNSPSFELMSEDNFMFMLRRLQGPVVVGVVAHEPIFVSGPAELEFVVVR